MKKLVVLLLTLAILVTAGVLFAVTAQSDDSLPHEEEKKELPPEGPKESEDYSYLTEEEFNALTEEQQEALRELKIKNERSIGRYYREEQIILGNITEDEPRLDLETAKQIIADFESGKYTEETVGLVFRKLFPYFDYRGGSGLDWTEYWLDDTGTKMLKLAFMSSPYYCEYDAEGNIVVKESLYDINPNNS